MVLQLIGAGLPRTGTSSLREALGFLLDAPVYHMSEAFARPEHTSTWVAAIGGHPPEWEVFLAGYAAGVDTPFSNCWGDLAAAYPDAPVLLSHRRDGEVWCRSMEATVLPRAREMLAKDDDDPMVPLFRAIFGGIFNDIDDRAEIIAGYDRWVRQVRAEVAPERLVDWAPGDGWEPICTALGQPVPDRPFPHVNTTADWLARQETRADHDEERVAAARSHETTRHNVDYRRSDNAQLRTGMRPRRTPPGASRSACRPGPRDQPAALRRRSCRRRVRRPARGR
jgi:hypothetical protein